MNPFLLALGLVLAATAQADALRVVVAANFQGTLEQLAPIYEEQSGHTLLISSGSTGSLFAQIQNGAPFDVFLSADPEQAEQFMAFLRSADAAGIIRAAGYTPWEGS